MLALEFAAFWLSGQWAGVPSGASVVIGSTKSPPNQASYKSWNINAAELDTGPFTIAHGFVNSFGVAITPDYVVIQPVGSALANWSVTIGNPNITVSKQAVVGSGGAPAAKLIVMVPHSIIQ